jgi:RHS repeat-associated protein
MRGNRRAQADSLVAVPTEGRAARWRQHAFRVGTVLAVVSGVLAPGVQAAHASPSSTPTVVLDPDHGYATSIRGGTTYNSFPVNLEVAQGVQALLPSVCAANISLTQTTDSLDNTQRAALMSNADVAVTLSMNSFQDGSPWGSDPAQGGSESFSTNRSDNLAFGEDLVQQMSNFTSRPHKDVNAGTTNTTTYPYAEYQGLGGTYAQVFMLYLDNNFDFPVWHDNPQYMVKAVTTAIADSLQAKGFKCLGTFPALPTAAELQRLRNLGYQQFLTYAAEPVSMSTGNFSTAESTFNLPGVGEQTTNLTLNYNAQSGEDSPVGVGWTFAYGAFMQQYSDGSVSVVLPDGRALNYPSDGSGGFTSPAGAFATLTQVDPTTFDWKTSTGTTLRFSQDASGRGQLVSTTDRQGNSETLTYGTAGSLFPRLQTITDQAGQQVAVTTDSDGRITSFTRPGGSTWQLGYSASGDLVSLTSPLGTTRHYQYDAQHRMTAEVGQDGVTFLTNTYDAKSRVVDQTKGFGDHRTIVYDDGAKTTTYTDATGATWTYHWNDLGEITSIEDPLGETSATSYNAGLLPTTQTNPLGQSTARSYDTQGQQTSLTDPLGNVSSSSYNSAEDLTSTTDQGGAGGAPRTYTFTVNSAGLPVTIGNPDGTTQHRTYDSVGDITSSTDENGATTSYTYDGRGNNVTITDPLGRVTHLTYDLADRLTSVTDPLGKTTSYTYDTDDHLTKTTYPNGSTELRSYDVNGQLASVTARNGGVTQYNYDAELNQTAITLPNGGVIHNTFDGEDRLTSTTDPLGNTTTYTLDKLGRRVATTDANGHTTKTGYDAAGNVISQTDASGAVTDYILDADGRIVKTTDPAGNTTTTAWDAVGRKTAVTKPMGGTTSYTYNFRDQVLTSTDPAGGVTHYSYDAAGRLVSKTDPAGAATHYSYDADGERTSSTNALGGTTSYVYDADGNQTGVTDPNGHTTTFTYDDMGQPISVTDPDGNTRKVQRDAAGLVTSARDALGDQTNLTYDVSSDLIAVTDPLGQTTHYGYDLDGQRVTETAPDGVETLSRFDPVGNLTAVVKNHHGGSPATSSTNVTTTYAYNARNLLSAVTDPNGNTTTYQYDQRGLRNSTTNPLGKITSYTYNADGEPASRTDANGATTNYSYNSRDLLVGRAYPSGTPNAFSYDADGRQVAATNSAGTIATTFDALGQVTKVVDAKGKALQYGYDPAGNRTQLTLPDGRLVGYSYDAANNLTQMTSPLGTSTFAYDAANRLTSVGRPNGTTETAAFDADSELTKLITKAGSSVLAGFQYSYDSAGDVSSRTETLGRVTTNATYTYDPLRRLVKDSGGDLPSTYTYDADGNRLTWTGPNVSLIPLLKVAFVQTNSYNAAGELSHSTNGYQIGRFTLGGTTTYSYDAAGNRVTSNGGSSSLTAVHYSYDFENKLLGVTEGSNPNPMDARTYDALGRLVSDRVGLVTTTWTDDGVDPIVGTDSKPTLYLRDTTGQLQGEQTTGQQPRWYVSDTLGSVIGMTGASSIFAASSAALIGPAPVSDYGVELGLGIGASRMGFDGQPAESTIPGVAALNLVNFYARSYDPFTGNWLQADPLPGNPASPSTFQPYQFANDNPTSNEDLLGFLSVGVAHAGTISSVGVASSYSGGSLQGGNVGVHALQPTITAQQLQPTVTAQQLQPTSDPFVRYGRSPTAYGIVESIQGPVGGSALQGTGSLALTIPHSGGVAPGGLSATDVTDLLSGGSLTISGGSAQGCLAITGNPEFCGGSGVHATHDVENTIYLAFGLGGVIKVGGSLLVEGLTSTAAEGSISLDSLAASGRVLDPADAGGQLTRAGRAYAKAGEVFGSTSGGPAAVNEAGQRALEDILTNPGTTSSVVQGGRFAGGLRFVSPDGIGVVFGPDGTVQYFGRMSP